MKHQSWYFMYMDNYSAYKKMQDAQKYLLQVIKFYPTHVELKAFRKKKQCPVLKPCHFVLGQTIISWPKFIGYWLFVQMQKKQIITTRYVSLLFRTLMCLVLHAWFDRLCWWDIYLHDIMTVWPDTETACH